MTSPEELLALIERHLEGTGETARSFGLRAAGDPNFVSDLRTGREPRRATVEKIMDAMQQRAA